MDDVHRDVYHYDSEGQLTERIEYNFNGDIMGKTAFKTTEEGFRIEQYWNVMFEGSYELRWERTFDQNNEETDEIRFDPQGRVEPPYKSRGTSRFEETHMDVDEGSIFERRCYNPNNQLSFRTETRYDLRGIHKEFSCFEPDGTMYLQDVYEHDYDSAGNWIREVQSHWVVGWGEFRLIPTTMTSRTIEYFD